MLSVIQSTTRVHRLSLLIVAVFCFACPVLGGHRITLKLAESVDLPANYEMDLSLGARQRSEILARGPEVPEDRNAKIGADVFTRLVAAEMVSGAGLPYHWRFVEINAPIVNASSTADGEIATYAGLVNLIGNNPGLWAAVLSHEITHTARRHIVRQVLFHMYIQDQLEYWERKQRLGDKGAGWAVLGIRVAGPIAEKKLSRSLEHDADVQGMLLMARVGYHPDYVFALHHILRIEGGEQSKFAAFFSDHPRWATRDQRNDKAYLQAVAEYKRLWPHPTASPGGVPPPVAFLADVRSSENKQRQTADITLALSCRNLSSPVRLHIGFKDKSRHALVAPSAQYADSVGKLDVSKPALCLDKDDASVTTIHIPASLIHGRNRKVKARVDVVAPDGQLLEQSKELDLHVPDDHRAGNALAEVEVDPPVSAAVLAPLSGSTPERTLADTRAATSDQADGKVSLGHAATLLETTKTDSSAQVGGELPQPRDLLHNAWSDSDDPEIRHTQQLIATWWPTAVQEQITQTRPAPNTQVLSDTALVMSTSKLTFPPQKVTSRSAPATVTVTNIGTSIFEISNIRVIGTNAEDFSASDTCGERVSAKSSCALTVWFAPQGYGPRRAAVALYDQGSRPNIVVLDGTGTAGPQDDR